MELFARDAVLAGPPAEVRTWATEIADAFMEATDRHVNCWTSIVGGVAGHYSWSMQVDGSAELVDNTMKALDSQTYLAKLEEGRHFLTGQPTDTLYRAYQPLGEDKTRVGSVAAVTQATSKAGSLGAAVGWGIEASEYVQRFTGLPTVLLGETAGKFSRLTWLTIAKDVAGSDEADRAVTEDDEYRKLIARGGDHFVDGSARQQVFLRIH